MKKITILTVLILTVFVSFAQLKSNAKLIREKRPEVYSKIRTLAVQKWQGDNNMIVYVINLQSDSYIKLQSVIKKVSQETAINYLNKWAYEIDGKLCIDYDMVLYEINLQLENSDY